MSVAVGIPYEGWCTPPGPTSENSALLYASIHRSAWNRFSPKFAFWGFCEVRIDGVLRSSPCPTREATQYELVINTAIERCAKHVFVVPWWTKQHQAQGRACSPEKVSGGDPGDRGGTVHSQGSIRQAKTEDDDRRGGRPARPAR